MSVLAAPAATLPRILRGVDGAGALASLDAHLREHGPLPDLRRLDREAIIDDIERAGLRGHGGAAFPTARKMRSVASRRRPKYVVVNATEGEPVSRKDRVLLREAPHLVLDGAAVAARAVGASEALVAFADGVPGTAETLATALEERNRRVAGDPRFHLIPTPDTYLAGQETALVNYLGGGPATPQFGMRPYERGIRQRPTLVQNAETLAHVALIARHGSAWFRSLGTEEETGSTLVTLAGALERPGVYEIEHGTSLDDLLELAGPSEPIAGLLFGGYFGTWVSGDLRAGLHLSQTDLRRAGAGLGAGVIVALGRSACPVAEITRVAGWFAEQSAGQCGPCVNGLAAISETAHALSTGTAHRSAFQDLRRWSSEIAGRGACQHPDGAVRFLTSGLSVFAAEFDDHASHGRCERCAGRPVLPVPMGSPALL